MTAVAWVHAMYDFINYFIIFDDVGWPLGGPVLGWSSHTILKEQKHGLQKENNMPQLLFHCQLEILLLMLAHY